MVNIPTETEKMLYETKEFLLSVIGESPVGTLGINLEGKIIVVNHQLIEILGKNLDVDELIGQDVKKIIEDIPELVKVINTCLKRGRKSFDLHSVEIRKKKEKTFLSIRGRLITVGMLIVVENITAEAAAAAAEQALEKQKKIDKAKTEFVSLASHQLRTPPTSINWLLEMLLSGEVGQLNEKQKEYAQEAYKNSTRMVTLINTLLNVSRMELGIFPVDPEPTEMIAFTKDVLEEFELQIKRKELQVEEQYAPKLPLIMVDPKLLRIVVQNIISNAVKYTPEKGTITIKIFLKQEDEVIGNRKLKTNSIVIIITDTGYGIPRNQSDKIFTKLFRADNIKDKDTGGTGLGLYLAKSIMDHVQGDLWFESELNRGTTFYLAIPSKGMEKKEGTKELVVEAVG